MTYGFLDAFWTLLCQMSLPLLFGYFAAGIISQFISPEFVLRHLSGKGFWQTVKASLFGIPLPLCSCGVLPVAQSLRKIGVGRGALTSFIISTPQTGVDSITVTYGILGPFLAIFRPFAAFISGVLGGIAVELFSGKEIIAKQETVTHCKSCCSDKSCGETSIESSPSKSIFAKFAKALKYGFLTLLGDTAGSLLIGLSAGALLNMLVPDAYFEKLAMSGGLVEMLTILVFGIPLYVCASASVPVAAVLIAKGISPGAAFVFLMTGPASNTVSFSFMLKMIGSRGLIIYLLTLAGTALLFGAIVNQFPLETVTGAVSHCASCEELGIFEQVGGIYLSFLIVLSLVKKR